ncbi:hypothetical protein GTZ99_04840 [Novosphingobium sp. FSY-8]|uniref:carbonic anhydrase n=1 Tax=Novosphingobium ovatum TaxID=1908523 RepID=A0ABW9XBK7_9SPHN|nr:carbonic anhydrase family protein [Novosphingobium ovatum]NBC35880.1 hypothetical protein [Novosphingobium ovatum]
MKRQVVLVSAGLVLAVAAPLLAQGRGASAAAFRPGFQPPSAAPQSIGRPVRPRPHPTIKAMPVEHNADHAAPPAAHGAEHGGPQSGPHGGGHAAPEGGEHPVSPALRQSPIDIATHQMASAIYPVPIIANWAPSTTLSVVNTHDPASGIDAEWATLKANVPPGSSSIQVGGVRYNLLQFHFHTPSEHSIDGDLAPMEVHFVFLREGAKPCDRAASSAQTDPLLVIGALIRPGAPHPELAKILNRADLPRSTQGGAISVPGFAPGRVLGPLAPSWRYAGSLTAPASFGATCDEPEGDIAAQLESGDFPKNVRWVVLQQPITASSDQIARFRALFPHGNARGVLPLRGRTVVAHP